MKFTVNSPKRGNQAASVTSTGVDQLLSSPRTGLKVKPSLQLEAAWHVSEPEPRLVRGGT